MCAVKLSDHYGRDQSLSATLIYIEPNITKKSAPRFSWRFLKYPLISRAKSSKAFVFGVFFGAIVFPLVAQAGILAIVENLFNTESAFADDEKAINNSQKLAVLEAQVIPNPDAAKKVATDIAIADNALVSDVGPVGTLADISGTDDSIGSISLYVVRKGDTIASVAKMFDVSANTILWANDLKKGQAIQEGTTLVILPVSGVQYTIKRGDTIAGIAKKFSVDDPADIEHYNDITGGLIAGTTIIIPGAELITQPINKNVQAVAKSSSESVSVGTGNGYFIRPLPYSCPRTQGIHDAYAIDIGCPIGTPIKAAADGTVMFAKTGWNGGYGNLIIISHQNGVRTFYAHQTRFAVSQGETVSQGQIIGYVGSTGRSTGPHLHFEVRGMKNPGFSDAPSAWKRQ
jgi:murein DD-endopeptidase MepM/ murein hydrolase activator NlpD